MCAVSVSPRTSVFSTLSTPNATVLGVKVQILAKGMYLNLKML